MNYQKPEQLVFRQVAFPVSAFDYIKEFQRGYEKTNGVRLNNNQILAVILAEHKHMTEESGEPTEWQRRKQNAPITGLGRSKRAPALYVQSRSPGVRNSRFE